MDFVCGTDSKRDTHRRVGGDKGRGGRGVGPCEWKRSKLLVFWCRPWWTNAPSLTALHLAGGDSELSSPQARYLCLLVHIVCVRSMCSMSPSYVSR